MNVFIWLSTGLSTVALICSVVAVVLSRRAIDIPKQTVYDWRQATEDYDYAIESIQSSIKRLNARVGMREARAKLAAQTTDSEDELPAGISPQRDGESPEAWKRRMRIAIQQGKFNGR